MGKAWGEVRMGGAVHRAGEYRRNIADIPKLGESAKEDKDYVVCLRQEK